MIRILMCLVALSAFLVPVAQAAEPDLTVIAVTFAYMDESKTKWLGEGGPFMNELLADPATKDVSDTLPFCEKALRGTLAGKEILFIVTKTTKLPAAMCSMNFVQSIWAGQTKEFIHTGISGFSPRVGGYVDAIGMPVTGEETMIGDLCISPVAVNENAFFSATTGFYWRLTWPTDTDYVVGSTDLAGRLYKASLEVDWPPLPEKPRANVLKYFGDEAVLRPNKAFYGNCAELTSDVFWHSGIDDLYARNWIVGPLNAVFNGGLDASDVVASTAMEGVALFGPLDKYNQLYDPDIAFALVRSSSNYDQPWVGRDMLPAVGAEESIDAGMTSGGGDEWGAYTEYLVVIQYLKTNR